MEIQGVEGLPDATFRRLTGVRKRTFIEMLSVLHTAEAHLRLTAKRGVGSRILWPSQRDS
ncbi:MAG: hypothetical protein OJF51_004887 [Nitrospira sp.]|jgi:hypothetical protein|nr:MAG: hypothetical protein OJF51_004887 [Nitrospira sp.]